MVFYGVIYRTPIFLFYYEISNDNNRKKILKRKNKYYSFFKIEPKYVIQTEGKKPNDKRYMLVQEKIGN